MAAPIVIKSSDSGTPVVNAVLGQMIVFFDEILVNRLGWTKVFSGENKAVYRPANAVGNRLFYRINNSADTVASGVRRFSITTYEAMSDVDNGTGASVPLFIYISGNTSTTAREWEVIGDGYGFHFLVKPLFYNDTYWQWYYFGEGIPFFSDDMWFSIITGDIHNGTNDAYSEALSYKQNYAGNEDIRIGRRRSGNVASIGVSSAFYSGGTTWNDKQLGTNYISYTYPTDGKLLYTRPYLNDGAAKTLRGIIPGLYAPEHGSGLVDKQEYSVDGKLLRYYGWLYATNRFGDTLGSLFIDIGVGYRP